MSRSPWRHLLSRNPYRIVRWGLALVFVFSGGIKLSSPQPFAEVISDLGLVYEWACFPLALGIAAVEVLAGLGLLVDLRGSLTTILVLLLLFAAVIAHGIRLGLDIDCGCFGIWSRSAGSGNLVGALVRDALLVAACLYLLASRWARGEGPWRIGEAVARFRKGERR